MSANEIETRTSYENENGTGIEIDPSDVRVTVTKDRNFFGTKVWSPAKVNWAALGSVPVARAEHFARVIAKAIEVAYELDTKYGTGA